MVRKEGEQDLLLFHCRRILSGLDIPLRYCEYKVVFFLTIDSNAMLVFTDEQVYCTKAPVIHSGLPNKFLVGETDKQSKKN